MTYQESQPKREKGLNGGRKMNLTAIDKVLKKRETGLKQKAISELTGIPLKTIEGYISNFTLDADDKVI